MHLWEARATADPRMGAGGYLEYQQMPDVTLINTSSCGVPGPMQRPTSGKSRVTTSTAPESSQRFSEPSHPCLQRL